MLSLACRLQVCCSWMPGCAQAAGQRTANGCARWVGIRTLCTSTPTSAAVVGVCSDASQRVCSDASQHSPEHGSSSSNSRWLPCGCHPSLPPPLTRPLLPPPRCCHHMCTMRLHIVHMPSSLHFNQAGRTPCVLFSLPGNAAIPIIIDTRDASRLVRTYV